MKLTTRITTLLVVVTTVVALGVGWYAVSTSTHSAYTALDANINAVVNSGKGDPNSALSEALNIMQSGGYDLTLDVVYPSGTVTNINAGRHRLRELPTLADVRDSLRQVVAVSNLPGFRIRSLNIGGGDYLVVAASTLNIVNSNRQLIARVALAAVAMALLMLVVARLFMRRDLQTVEDLIDFASDVAEGNAYEQIPPSRGSRDVRELQRALAQMVASLQEKIEHESRQAETMQLFIGDASHELRTPLTVIKGYSELMSSPGITEEQQARALERVRREVDRMEALVSDLLLLAEIRELPTSGHDTVNLSALVDRAVADFREDGPTRLVEEQVEGGVLVQGRPDFVVRLITNALSNISRHTRADAPARISLERTDDCLLLTVEDGGEGLPVYGVRPDRFRRFDPSRSRSSGGSGLGMSIMSDLAESMGGSMGTSRSSLGGLCLTFTLPIVN